MPGSQCPRTMEAKYPEAKPMDERPRYGFRSPNRDTNSTCMMGTRQTTTRTHGATICREAAANRVGQNDGQLALVKMERVPRQNLETCKIKEIQLVMDHGTHPEIMGRVLGHVGTSQQRTTCWNRNSATNHTLSCKRQDQSAVWQRSPAAPKRCAQVLATTDGDDTTVLVSLQTNLARCGTGRTIKATKTWVQMIPWRTMLHGDMDALSKKQQHPSRCPTWLSEGASMDQDT